MERKVRIRTIVVSTVSLLLVGPRGFHMDEGDPDL